jgi:hypothetical protein
VYYNYVKFEKNPISRLGGVALTRYMGVVYLVSAIPPKRLIGVL